MIDISNLLYAVRENSQLRNELISTLSYPTELWGITLNLGACSSSSSSTFAGCELTDISPSASESHSNNNSRGMIPGLSQDLTSQCSLIHRSASGNSRPVITIFPSFMIPPLSKMKVSSYSDAIYPLPGQLKDFCFFPLMSCRLAPFFPTERLLIPFLVTLTLTPGAIFKLFLKLKPIKNPHHCY